MKPILRLVPAFLLFMALGAAMLYPSWGSMTLTTDGVNYLTTAENLAKFKGAYNYSGKAELAHPYGYSVALVPFVWMGWTSQQAAFIVALLSLAILGLFSWLLISHVSGKSSWLEIAGALMVESTPAIFKFSNQILSETLCAALVVLFLWLCIKRVNPWIMALTALALCFTRYPGGAIVVGAGLFLKTWRERWIVVGIPLLVVGMFALGSGQVLPNFNPPIHQTIPGKPEHVLVGTLALLTGWIAIAFMLDLIFSNWKKVNLLIGATVVYLVGLALSTAGTHIDPTIDERLFIPVVGLFVIILLGTALKQSRRLGVFLLGALACINISAAAKLGPAMANYRNKGLNNPALKTEPVISFLSSLPSDIPLYSSSPAFIYHCTKDHKVAKFLPHLLLNDSTSKQAMYNEIACSNGFLVWFRRFSNGYVSESFFKDILYKDSTGRILFLADSTAVVFATKGAIRR